MKIIFSDLAIETLGEIIDFLNENWTEKELMIMKNDFKSFKEKVLQNYKIYPLSQYGTGVREAIIGNKQVKIIFEVAKDEVLILLFWNNKGDTKRLINLIKKRI